MSDDKTEATKGSESAVERVVMRECTDMMQRARTDHLLNMAYSLGRQKELDELEILKRFVLTLLDLKDEAFQEKVNELMRSTKPLFL